MSLFDDGDITWDDLAGLDFQLFPITNDLVCVKSPTKEDMRLKAHSGLHGDASFELFDDVTRLFLLVPADKSIEHKNSNLNIPAE